VPGQAAHLLADLLHLGEQVAQGPLVAGSFLVLGGLRRQQIWPRAEAPGERTMLVP
jgi:hypothetical protein